MTTGKVTGVETSLLEMPYTKPLVTATNNFTVARGLLAKVITDGGIEGYGYSDLFPRTGETPQTAQHVIDTVLKPKVVGRDLEDLARLRADMDHALTGNPRAKSALETAMYDALARSYHMPLAVMLGGKYRSEIRVIKMVSVDTPEKMAEEARQLARDGLALKLKVSGKIDKDLPRVAAVRKAVGDDVFIKIDANEAYDAKTAIRLAKSLADHGIEVFEQPVPRDQFDALREVKQHAPIKIEADQSCRTFADAQTLIRIAWSIDQHRHCQSRQHRRSAPHRRAVRAEWRSLRALEHGGQHGRRCSRGASRGEHAGNFSAVRARRVRGDHRRSVLRTVSEQRRDQCAGGRGVGGQSQGVLNWVNGVLE
jgi:L-alanine-DL-glutamate epimerase-like enolase superfamily enzyme